jgi:ubiquinone/menaquinone biosynthesis C-methylase UbiE
LGKQRGHYGERVLDVGCGTGNYTLALAEAGFDAVGIDYAPGMLKRAREKAIHQVSGRASVSFESGDLNQPLGFPDNSFDHAICIYAFQCVVDPSRFLSEVRRVLKPGGLFLVAAPQPDIQAFMPARAPLLRRIFWRLKTMASTARRVRKYNRDELRAILADAGFDVVEDRTNARSIEFLGRAGES